MTAAAGKAVREGSAAKRTAILTAARELFLTDGYDRTSVDAVSARAQVSKRTVYDYFGDKRALLLAVVEQAAESLIGAIRAAVDEELTLDRDVEAALQSFTARIATATFGSSDYAALLRLVATESAHLPEVGEHWLTTAPEQAIAERFAEFGRAGLLDVPDPLLAADHFVALTFLLAQNKLGGPLEPGMGEAQEVLVQGVRAFLRAYAPAGGR
jgi:TetR/AcrR family transcriptional repressor of mexJK operon